MSFASMLAKGVFIAVLVAVCLFSMDANAAVSMANVTTETTTVRTWMVVAGAIAIAAGILIGLYLAYGRNPFSGIAALVITVIAATLFTAALM